MAPTSLGSGIDIQYFDNDVRPQDDFYRHVNGAWLSSTQIPADKGRYGSFDKLNDDTLEKLRGLIERLPESAVAGDPEQQKIVDLYHSFMDEAALQRLDLSPLAAELARVTALKRKTQIPALIAHLAVLGISAPYVPRIEQDARDSSRYVFDLRQGGLGLPDRDYYLQDDPQLSQTRASYLKHIETMLHMAGQANAAQQAHDILALETELAKVQWSKVENRDPVKTYNRFELPQLAQLAPGYQWNSYLAAAGVAGKIDYLVIDQPSYISAFNKLLQQTPLAIWKCYFRWRLLSEFAPFLSARFVDEGFAFYG